MGLILLAGILFPSVVVAMKVMRKKVLAKKRDRKVDMVVKEKETKDGRQ